jgi:hypothetical protein
MHGMNNEIIRVSQNLVGVLIFIVRTTMAIIKYLERTYFNISLENT